MVAHKAVRLANEECGTCALAHVVHEFPGDPVDGPHVLAIDAFGMKSERSASGQHVARYRLRIVGVFVIEIIFANVDHRKLPQRRHIHDFVEEPLSKRAIAEEAHRNLIGLQALGGKRGPCRDS